MYYFSIYHKYHESESELESHDGWWLSRPIEIGFKLEKRQLVYQGQTSERNHESWSQHFTVLWHSAWERNGSVTQECY